MKPTPPLAAPRVAAGVFAAFVWLAAFNAAVIAVRVPLSSGGVRLRAAYHVVDLAETLGIGLGAALVASVIVRAPRWGSAAAAFGATALVAWMAVGENLMRFASLTLDGRFDRALYVGYLSLLSIVIPGGAALALRYADTRRLRWIPVALGAAVLAAVHAWEPDEYPGIHCIIALGAAMLVGGGLASSMERAVRAGLRSRAGRALLASTVVVSIAGIAYTPSNALRVELFRQPCAIAPWVLATTLWRSPALRVPSAPQVSQWFVDRSAAPPILRTAPRIVAARPVVVLITVDALRADVVSDAANDTLLPTFTALKREGVFFTHASAPASQTALSLGTLFSARYFSEQLWTDHGSGRGRFLYPADDGSPRFPELLVAGGVTTFHDASLTFLAGEFGVARGFSEEHVVVNEGAHARAASVIDPLIDRLEHADDAPLFAYAHLMEPHAPYDRGRKDGTPRERYLSEVAIVDTQLARIISVLESRFGWRWVLIVTADHGEAFGEHQTTGHAKTLYEELLHVPLLIRSPFFPKHVVEQRVGLVDLAPTILDLFGMNTPATFDGQNLGPILVNHGVTLTRPLLAEGRLRRAITSADGLKVIEDSRRKTVEAYDLVRDPLELNNLFDLEPQRVDAALATLRQFFALHARRTDGYEPPYKP